MHHYFDFPGSMFMPFFAIGSFLLLITVWSIAIKGYALWTAARANQPWWFVALLVINTAGILEVVYLIWYAPAGSNKLSNAFNSRTVHTPAEHAPPPPQA